MEYNTLTLPNGLRIIHLWSPSPVVYCGYDIAAGSRDELPGEEGLAHFCEHATFKGTARRRSWNVLNCLERVGGDLNAYTTKEDTVFHSAVLREHTAKAVDLLTDIVFHSAYPQAELERETEVVCDEIESYNDTPSELIFDEFENIIFAGHPLGHNILGSAELLHTYTSAHAKRFTSRGYRADNAVFFAYGDVDFGRLVALLEKATADLPSPAAKDERRAATLPHYEPTEKTISRGTHQAHVMIGTRAYAARDPRRMALHLLNNLLGGPAMNARLNLALRERNGLVYTVDSSMVAYADTGAWSVYFGCDPKDVARCRRLVGRELQKVAEKPLTPTQLAAAKRQLKGQISIAADSRESFALDFGRNFLRFNRGKDIARLAAQIDALTADELQAVAQETFRPDGLTTLIYI